MPTEKAVSVSQI